MPSELTPVRPDLADAIERWDREGLLEPGQADRLRADLADHADDLEHRVGDEAVDGPEPGDVGSRLESAVQAGLEALGYLGAALVVGAVIWLGDIPNWSDPGLLALLAAVAAGCGTAVARLTPAEPGMGSRLATVVGTAGLFALGGFLMILFEPSCPDGCGWAAERLLPLAIALPTTGAAWWLHHREENALSHAWFGMGVATSLLLISQLPFTPTSRDWRAEEVATAVVLLPAALGWVWASETDRLRPAWIGTLGASGIALASTVNLVDVSLLTSRGNDLIPMALLVFGAAYIALGTSVERWRLTTIGAVVLVWGVPWTLVDVFGLSETTTALLLLPVGLALVGFATRRLLSR